MYYGPSLTICFEYVFTSLLISLSYFFFNFPSLSSTFFMFFLLSVFHLLSYDSLSHSFSNCVSFFPSFRVWAQRGVSPLLFDRLVLKYLQEREGERWRGEEKREKWGRKWRENVQREKGKMRNWGEKGREEKKGLVTEQGKRETQASSFPFYHSIKVLYPSF